MIKVDRGDKSFWLDGYIHADIGDAISWRRHDWDSIFTVVGREGAGKSTLAAQLCSYADPNFSINNIVFTPDQFKAAIQDNPKETAILWDEAITGADSAIFMTKKSVEIIQLLTQARRKRLFIVICFPYLYKLNKYYVSRSVGLFYVYASAPDKRGKVIYYNNWEMNKIYGLMKVSAYYRVFPEALYRIKSLRSYYGTFNKNFLVDKLDYENKKDIALKSIDKKGLSKTARAKIIKDYFPELTHSQIAKKLGISRQVVSSA